MKVSRFLAAAAVAATVMATCATRICIAQGANSNGSCQGIWSGMLVSSGSAGSAALEADISQSGSSVTGTAVIHQGIVENSGTISGTNSTSTLGISINLGTAGKLSATINLHGSVGSGNYTLTGPYGSPTDTGTLAMTLQPGLTTANVSGTYVATQLSDSSGTPITGSAFYLLQTGNNLYVSTLWNGTIIFNGTGTVIGNSITFHITQVSWVMGPPNMISGSATVSNGLMTGISFMGSPTGKVTNAIAFSAPFAMPIYP